MSVFSHDNVYSSSAHTRAHHARTHRHSTPKTGVHKHAQYAQIGMHEHIRHVEAHKRTCRFRSGPTHARYQRVQIYLYARSDRSNQIGTILIHKKDACTHKQIIRISRYLIVLLSPHAQAQSAQQRHTHPMHRQSTHVRTKSSNCIAITTYWCDTNLPFFVYD